MKEKTATLTLSASQRNLLLRYEKEFDDPDLFRLIAVAIKKDGDYEITLTPDQLESLCDSATDFAISERNDTQAEQLNELCNYLEDCLDDIQVAVESKNAPSHSKNTGGVYVFKVALEGNAKIWRMIAIRGGQTLDDLHRMIFEAFDRYDEHLYSFYIPDEPSKKRPARIHYVSTEYTHPYALEECGFYGKANQNAAKATIDSLKLSSGQTLYYLFDFGDEWWHTLTVEKTDGFADNGKYPRILERKGKSPEQYPDYDEDDE